MRSKLDVSWKQIGSIFAQPTWSVTKHWTTQFNITNTLQHAISPLSQFITNLNHQIYCYIKLCSWNPSEMYVTNNKNWKFCKWYSIQTTKYPHLHESVIFFLCTWPCSNAKCFTSILYLISHLCLILDLFLWRILQNQSMCRMIFPS